MLQHKFENVQIILASQSPRRRELLKGLDINFTVAVKPVNEVYDSNLKAGEITTYLSQLKAKAFNDSLLENQLLITSDTIVWLNNRALEKPKNTAHAKEMLETLSNTTHEVYTTVCFTTIKQQQLITDCTQVYIKSLSCAEIEYYVNTYAPLDKAGAYGIQDWLGYTAVHKITGCYYNVMGLPLPMVYEVLKNWKL